MNTPNKSFRFEAIEVIGYKDQEETVLGRHNPLIVTMDHVIHFHQENYLKYYANRFDKIEVRFRGEYRKISQS